MCVLSFGGLDRKHMECNYFLAFIAGWLFLTNHIFFLCFFQRNKTFSCFGLNRLKNNSRHCPVLRANSERQLCIVIILRVSRLKQTAIRFAIILAYFFASLIMGCPKYVAILRMLQAGSNSKMNCCFSRFCELTLD